MLSNILLLSLISSSLGLGDFPCAGVIGSQSCLLWSTDSNRQGNISATAVCQPDPVHPTVSYCGYANAPCTTNLDCDYGSCGTNGTCTGYLGDPCPNGSVDCQAFFFCGTGGTCGSAGAPCNNSNVNPMIPVPNDQCLSASCNGTAEICNAPPAAGVPIDFGCGNSDVCASGFCGPLNTCRIKVSLPAPSQAAAAGLKKRKRYFNEGKEVFECPKGLESCKIGGYGGEGYECLSTKNSLENCGVCGNDCTAIEGVERVACQSGHCVIETCQPGKEMSNNGHSCVAASRR